MATKKRNFEESIKRIEDIICIIENEQTSLEHTLKLYKEGIELSGFCMSSINQTEKEVMLLTKNLEGNFSLEKFETSED